MLDRFNLNHMRDETCFDSVGNKARSQYQQSYFCQQDIPEFEVFQKKPCHNMARGVLNWIGNYKILQIMEHKNLKLQMFKECLKMFNSRKQFQATE